MPMGLLTLGLTYFDMLTTSITATTSSYNYNDSYNNDDNRSSNYFVVEYHRCYMLISPTLRPCVGHL